MAPAVWADRQEMASHDAAAGWLAVLGAVACWGSFGVPIKSRRVLAAEVGPEERGWEQRQLGAWGGLCCASCSLGLALQRHSVTWLHAGRRAGVSAVQVAGVLRLQPGGAALSAAGVDGLGDSGRHPVGEWRSAHMRRFKAMRRAVRLSSTPPGLPDLTPTLCLPAHRCPAPRC